jgi:Flp pilus assembly pilin Flp
MRWMARRVGGEDGSATVEYALILLVAAAFAVTLYTVVTSGVVSAALGRVVTSALSKL